ncbi:MAG: NAD/NADP octopine/nopaline dehydrogenase family protein [Muribaculaceae bacterium]|nr:NAD/NADP octopine/nopaline dehydrogenase family protein [Muribaculaceae bacterium]
MTICICGGGGLGLVCAGVFLSRGVKVRLMTGHPADWSRHIKVYDKSGKEYSGELSQISSDPQDVIPGSDIIFLTLPGYLIQETLEHIRPYLDAHASVGTVVSSTGFFFAAHEVLHDKYTLFGFQRVPYIARARKYGEIGDLLGYKDSLKVAIENCPEAEELRQKLEWLFDTPVTHLNNFYEASLTNSNPILHTGRMYAMWRNCQNEKYDRQSYFYSDWDNESSEYIISMDEEFQKLLRTLGIKEGVIPPLLNYYESADAESLTRKIKSIPAFQSIMSPMKQEGDIWVPDFTSRYFTEDFPYGLRFIKELAAQHSVATPVIDEVYDWGMSMIGQ